MWIFLYFFCKFSCDAANVSAPSSRGADGFSVWMFFFFAQFFLLLVLIRMLMLLGCWSTSSAEVDWLWRLRLQEKATVQRSREASGCWVGSLLLGPTSSLPHSTGRYSPNEKTAKRREDTIGARDSRRPPTSPRRNPSQPASQPGYRRRAAPVAGDERGRRRAEAEPARCRLGGEEGARCLCGSRRWWTGS